MKTLLLLRGLPGNGKTTLAESLQRMGAVIASADDYMVDDSGNYDFRPEKLGYAHQRCQQYVERFMDNTFCELIVVHNTLTTEKEMKPYYEMAEKYGYMVHSLIVENRHGGKSVHDVPEETLDKMEKRFSIKLR